MTVDAALLRVKATCDRAGFEDASALVFGGEADDAADDGRFAGTGRAGDDEESGLAFPEPGDDSTELGFAAGEEIFGS